MTALCIHCRVMSAQAGGGGVRRIRWWQVRGGRCGCQLSGFSTCWEVGKLESWEVGGARWCERKSRKTGEGQPCKRERTQDRAYQKKGGGHTRLHLSPMKGRRRKESAPTHSHRTGRREERGINHSTEKGIPRTITPTQGGVDGTPGKTPLANGQLLPT